MLPMDFCDTCPQFEPEQPGWAMGRCVLRDVEIGVAFETWCWSHPGGNYGAGSHAIGKVRQGRDPGTVLAEGVDTPEIREFLLERLQVFCALELPSENARPSALEPVVLDELVRLAEKRAIAPLRGMLEDAGLGAKLLHRDVSESADANDRARLWSIGRAGLALLTLAKLAGEEAFEIVAEFSRLGRKAAGQLRPYDRSFDPGSSLRLTAARELLQFDSDGARQCLEEAASDPSDYVAGIVRRWLDKRKKGKQKKKKKKR